MAQDTFSTDFSTLIDGTSSDWEWVRDIKTDADGNVYVVGGSSAGAGISVSAGLDYKTAQGSGSLGSLADADAFVMKLSSTGQLLWSARLGGEGNDFAHALDIDGAGNVYVAGRAGDGLSTTAGSYQTGFGGNQAGTTDAQFGQQDGFVARLDGETGALDWATYVGGDDGGYVADLAVSADGELHLAMTAMASTTGAPITQDGLQTSISGATDAAYVQMTHDGSAVTYGTFLGGTETGTDGSGISITLGKTGNVSLAFATDAADLTTTANAYQDTLAGGTDAYVVTFDGANDNTTLHAATYFGSSGDEVFTGAAIDTDASGNVYIGGSSFGTNLPTSPGAIQGTNGGSADGFVARFSADGTSLQGATYLGGSKKDEIEALVVTDNGVYVTGSMISRDFGVTDTSISGSTTGSYDAYFGILTHDLGSTDYSTFIAGSAADRGRAMDVGADGSLVVGGLTRSGDIPFANPLDSSLNGAYGGWVTRLTPDNATPVTEDDMAFTDSQTALTIAVLGNDVDADGDTMTVTALDPAQHGTTVINPNGSITYTPDAGFTGVERLEYTVSDGNGHTARATLEILVAPPLPTSGSALLGYSFDYGSEGAIYMDDLFAGTSAPGYAAGRMVNGCVTVDLGGLDATPATDMSGGWLTHFNLDTVQSVSVSFRYRAELAAELASDAVVDLLASIDGSLVGSGIATLLPGTGTMPAVTDWTYVTLDLGDLSAGFHSFAFGAHLNKKTGLDDTARIWFDDFMVWTDAPAQPPLPAPPAPDAETILLTIGDDVLNLGNGADNFDGSLGNDVLNGKGGSDRLFGGEGDDVLSGANHDDTLVGGAGDDQLRGGVGDDILWGGTGRDVLIGDSAAGGGADTFCFAAVDLAQQDIIKDFNAADGDVIDLSHAVTGFDGQAASVRDYVKLTEVSGRTVVWVDADGGGDSWVRAIALQDVTGMASTDTLWSDGTLVL